VLSHNRDAHNLTPGALLRRACTVRALLRTRLARPPLACSSPATSLTRPRVAPLARGDAAAEPRRITRVECPADIEAALWAAYLQAETARQLRGGGGRGGGGGAAVPALYGSAEEFLALVRQTLSRDIRSLHQRTGPAAKRAPVYHVILCCVEVDYVVDDERVVRVTGGGRVAVPEADWEKVQAVRAVEMAASLNAGEGEEDEDGVE